MIRLLAFLLASAFSASLAYANSVELLSFDGLQNEASVANYYNGGARGVPNYHVSFSPNFMGLRTVLVNGAGNFMPDPTRTAIIFISGAAGTNVTGVMNAAQGFSSGINFFYTAAFSETATVWSGSFGSGTALATINLSPNDSRCGSIGYCNWTPIGVKFSGTAESVTFSGPANGMGLADITLGRSNSAVPEPSSLYLLGTGIVCFGTQGIRRWIKR